jgi:hypothetical protein
MINMEKYWAVVMTLVGLWMIVSSITKSKFIIYRLIHARAKIFWKDKAHLFILVSGVIISFVGMLLYF